MPNAVAAPCCHHWLIGPADGPTSWGVCRKCGAQREFLNSAAWFEDGSRIHGAGMQYHVPKGERKVREGD